MTKERTSMFLDVDKSILENKLMLEENKEEDLESLLPFLQSCDSNSVPWKLVQPTQGLCIKTHTTGGAKVFVNLCQTDEIPCPEFLEDEVLLRLWSSEDAGSYRLPMSIGEGHQEPDKSGNPVMAYDVALNPQLLKKIETNKLYLKFLVTIVLEAIQDKFEVELDTEDYSILKHRKAMGKLQMHRIKQHPTEIKAKKPLIEELSNHSTSKIPTTEENSKQKTMTSVMLPSEGTLPSSGCRQPEYYIWQQPEVGDPQVLVAELRLGEVLGAREVSLDVGEDRLIVESRRHGYLLDVFVPHSIDQDKTCAQFNTDSRILTVTMPIQTAN